MAQPAFLYQTTVPTVTATDAYSGTAADNVLHATEDTYWRPANQTGSKDLTFDFGAAVALDFFALCGESLDGITVEVRGSTDNFSASDVQVDAGAAISGDAAAWRSFTSDTYRYWRLRFSSFPNDLKVCHTILGALDLLPYLEKDWDDRQLSPQGKHLISQAGYYAGSAQQRTMREMSIKPGQVVDVSAYTSWAEQCVKDMKAFFFVPDTDESGVYFGWTKSKFSAPMDRGMYSVSQIRFETRA